MLFELSDRAKMIEDQLLRFMDEHVYPAERVVKEQMEESDDPHVEPTIVRRTFVVEQAAVVAAEPVDQEQVDTAVGVVVGRGTGRIIDHRFARFDSADGLEAG